METTKSARASQEWQRKWAKAILTLVFHFDDLDDVTAANFERQVEQVGAVSWLPPCRSLTRAHRD